MQDKSISATTNPIPVPTLGDCVDGLGCWPKECVDLVFCDPPFNIGYDYGEDGVKDSMPPGDYELFSKRWLRQVHRVLKPHGTLWVAIGDDWAAELKIIAREVGFHLRSWVIWYYTFGVNCQKKFNRSHTHLLYFTKHRTRFTFNKDACRVPSARAAVYNDKRADPRGRLPDDTWILRPQQIPEAFQPFEDTWHIPRVCGTFKERQQGAANQMPESLLARVILNCSQEGDIVLDPMAGTGTTLAVAKKLSRVPCGFELVERYCKLAQARVEAAKPGDALD